MTEWWKKPARLLVEKNIPFCTAGGEELLLDVFRPDTDEVRPGMVGIVGGGWRNCNKAGFEMLCSVLASHGYVTANLSYRIAPKHPWPACMQDVKTGVRWFRAHAEQYGLDPTRVGALGSSAGGHLATMLAVTPSDAHFGGEDYPDQPTDIQAAVCMCAPTDMVALYEYHKEDGVLTGIAGGTPDEVPEVYREASPATYISPDVAPCMFIHGDVDKTVPFEPTRRMSERLRECGVDSPFLALPGVGHGARLYVSAAASTSPMPQIIEFLAKHLGGDAS
jgi:acetyl esterase/lipase